MKRFKNLKDFIKDLYFKFKALSTKGKVLSAVLSILLMMIVLGIGYLLYKIILIVFPILIIGLLFHWSKQDDVPQVQYLKPEQFNISADSKIISDCLARVIGNVGALLNFKEPSLPDNLYVGVLGSDKLLFKILKRDLKTSEKDMLDIKSIEHVLNEELYRQFMEYCSFFVTTKEGIQVMGVQEQTLYYQVLITPINDNTRTMILNQLASKANQPESRQPKDLSDDF